MKYLEMHNLSPVERLRVAAGIGLAMLLMVFVARLLDPPSQDPSMYTRVLCIAVLGWFVFAARPGSMLARHITTMAMLIPLVLLGHMLLVLWLSDVKASYFFVGILVLTVLSASAISSTWINLVLASWSSGLFAIVLLTPTSEISLLNAALLIVPAAGMNYLLGHAFLKSRAELEQQRHWLEKAQSVSKMAGWDYDPRSKKFTWSAMSNGLIQLDNIQDRSPAEFVSEHDWERLLEGVEQCLKNNDDFELVVHGEDGLRKPRWYSVKAGRVGEPENYRVVGVFTDVTETVAKERELTRAKEAAESAAAARTRFLANMSHEIRTPMNGVIGMASLLLDGELGAKERSYAEIIRNSGESLLTIINQILDFSKFEAGNVTIEEGEFELEQLVVEALDIVDHLAERKAIKLHLDMPLNTIARYRGDASRLRQVLVNLLSNAVKFTEKGSVTLVVERNETQHRNGVVFEVIDTGIGITPAALPHLFDPFVQGDASTTRKFGGTGLGLAISREIVHAMNGKIDVYSHPKEGSKFRVEVPLRLIKDEVLPVLSDSQPRHYQLVSEDRQLAEIIAARMSEIGAEVDCCETAAAVPPGNQMVLLDTAYVEPMVIEDFVANPDREVVLLGALSQRSGFSNYQDVWLRIPVLPSNFLVALNLKDMEHTDREETRDELEQFNHLRVLLAEDNAINQKVAQQMLKKLGCVADIAQNGRETIDMLCEKEYDLIFMDVQMPEVDGLEATRLIRVNDAINQPYIVAMTANVMQEDREVCRLAGMDDFVAKPVRLGEVSKALRRASNQINAV